MSKKYFYTSKYQIPYGSVPSFESKIEFPLASENLALLHLRSNNPTGFWNNGILGSIIGQIENHEYKLPASPICLTPEKIILPSEFNSEVDSLTVILSFYEGLDSVPELRRILKEALARLNLRKIHLGIEFVPLLPEYRTSSPLGVDELVLKLSKEFEVELFNYHELSKILFSKKDHFLHIHNKVFYYYSIFEVKAKMNGASVIYLHPQTELSLDITDLDLYKTILNKKSLNLIELNLFARHFINLKFGVSNA